MAPFEGCQALTLCSSSSSVYNPYPVQPFMLSLALNTGYQIPCPDVPEFIKAHRRFSLSSRLTMNRTVS